MYYNNCLLFSSGTYYFGDYDYFTITTCIKQLLYRGGRQTITVVHTYYKYNNIVVEPAYTHASYVLHNNIIIISRYNVFGIVSVGAIVLALFPVTFRTGE